MDVIGQTLATGGALGLVLVILFGLLLFFVLPIAAIIDCAASDNQSGSKIFMILILLVTWGVVSLFYCLFFAQSRLLRKLTAVVLIGAVLAFFVSGTALFKGSQLLQEEQEKQDALERQQVIDAFTPSVLEADDIDAFPALHPVSFESHNTSPVLATFTMEGPDLRDAVSLSTSIRDITQTPDGLYAITDHEVGRVSQKSGQFIAIDLKSVFPNFSWPKGICYDAKNDRLIVMTSHVYQRIYALDRSSGEWMELSQERHPSSLRGLTFDPNREAFFSIIEPSEGPTLTRLARFTLNGSLVDLVDLDPVLPISEVSAPSSLQIHAVSDHLILLVPSHKETGTALYAVDPNNGEVKGLPK